MKKFLSFFLIATVSSLLACGQSNTKSTDTNAQNKSEVIYDGSEIFNGKKIEEPNTYWQNKLTPEQFYVCREEGTERAFTGTYWDQHEEGIYFCIACGLPLFKSETKFDSGTGWPSFYQPIQAKHVKENVDSDFGMVRTEVECARCGSHLGHLFDDAYNQPTGLRYCINSVSLYFQKL